MSSRSHRRTRDGKHPGHYIREWRLHRGLTQKQLAALVGCTDGNLSQLEMGGIGYSQPLLEALATALGCHPAQLLNPPSAVEVMELVGQLDDGQKDRFLRLMKILMVEWSRVE